MMTNQDIKAVLCAAVDGKKIERLSLDNVWCDIVQDYSTIAEAIYDGREYRVKPGPQLIPWTINTYDQKILRVKRNTDAYYQATVTEIDTNGIYANGLFRSWDDLFSHYLYSTTTSTPPPTIQQNINRAERPQNNNQL